jgi:hypothetical protein
MRVDQLRARRRSFQPPTSRESRAGSAPHPLGEDGGVLGRVAAAELGVGRRLAPHEHLLDAEVPEPAQLPGPVRLGDDLQAVGLWASRRGAVRGGGGGLVSAARRVQIHEAGWLPRRRAASIRPRRTPARQSGTQTKASPPITHAPISSRYCSALCQLPALAKALSMPSSFRHWRGVSSPGVRQKSARMRRPPGARTRTSCSIKVLGVGRGMSWVGGCRCGGPGAGVQKEKGDWFRAQAAPGLRPAKAHFLSGM